MSFSREAWNELASPIAPSGNLDAIFDKMAGLYNEPHRHYHNSRHIAECLTEFESAKHLTQQDDLLELALWFHDAIYDPHRHDNEEQSANLARDLLKPHLPESSIHTISRLILATKHLAPASEPDAKLIVDIDLSILGKDPTRFDEYEQQIRAEYAFVPESTFREKRAEILNSFLARPRLFETAHFYEKFERAARSNLARSISKLS